MYWTLGGAARTDRSKALGSLLLAARLDAGHASTFTYLGLFYAQVEGDRARAKKCFQKALSLDVLDETAGMFFLHCPRLTRTKEFP